MISDEWVMLLAVGRQARDHSGQLLEHHRPTVFGAVERLLLLESRMLEQQSSASAVGLEAVAYARVQKLTDHPGKGQVARWIALQDLTIHHQAVEAGFGVRWHTESEVVTDTRLEVVRIHPVG